MSQKLVIANWCRTIGRIITILVIPVMLFYLLFIGLQVASGEGGYFGLTLNIFMFLLLVGGLVVCWFKEFAGIIIAFIGLVGYVVAGLATGTFDEAFGSPMMWPCALVVAFIKEQSFDPMPTWILIISWLLLILPIGLFLTSWWLRRQPASQESPQTTGMEE